MNRYPIISGAHAGEWHAAIHGRYLRLVEVRQISLLTMRGSDASPVNLAPLRTCDYKLHDFMVAYPDGTRSVVHAWLPEGVSPFEEWVCDALQRLLAQGEPGANA
jgi:hypothetical protein